MKLKIVNMPKFIMSCLTILIIIGMGIFFFSNASLSYGELKYEKVYACEGDTLWTLASSQSTINPYYKDKDIRYIVTDIKKVNQLEDSSIYENQELLIPTL